MAGGGTAQELEAGIVGTAEHLALRRTKSAQVREAFKAWIDEMANAGPENLQFAWAGPADRSQGHAYRVQGPTFLIEFNNTQKIESDFDRMLKEAKALERGQEERKDKRRGKE